jgi:hypothetical protein
MASPSGSGGSTNSLGGGSLSISTYVEAPRIAFALGGVVVASAAAAVPDEAERNRAAMPAIMGLMFMISPKR